MLQSSSRMAQVSHVCHYCRHTTEVHLCIFPPFIQGSTTLMFSQAGSKTSSQCKCWYTRNFLVCCLVESERTEQRVKEWTNSFLPFPILVAMWHSHTEKFWSYMWMEEYGMLVEVKCLCANFLSALRFLICEGEFDEQEQILLVFVKNISTSLLSVGSFASVLMLSGLIAKHTVLHLCFPCSSTYPYIIEQHSVNSRCCRVVVAYLKFEPLVSHYNLPTIQCPPTPHPTLFKAQ